MQRIKVLLSATPHHSPKTFFQDWRADAQKKFEEDTHSTIEYMEEEGPASIRLFCKSLNPNFEAVSPEFAQLFPNWINITLTPEVPDSSVSIGSLLLHSGIAEIGVFEMKQGKNFHNPIRFFIQGLYSNPTPEMLRNYLTNRANCYFLSGQLERAKSDLLETFSIERGSALHNLGLIYKNLGETQVAEDFLYISPRESLDLEADLEKTQVLRELAAGYEIALLILSLVFEGFGHINVAKDSLETISQSTVSTLLKSTALHHLGRLEWESCNQQRALQYLKQALDVISNQTQDRIDTETDYQLKELQGAIHYYLAKYYGFSLQIATALQHYQMAINVLRDIGSKSTNYPTTVLSFAHFAIAHSQSQDDVTEYLEEIFRDTLSKLSSISPDMYFGVTSFISVCVSLSQLKREFEDEESDPLFQAASTFKQNSAFLPHAIICLKLLRKIRVNSPLYILNLVELYRRAGFHRTTLLLTLKHPTYFSQEENAENP